MTDAMKVKEARGGQFWREHVEKETLAIINEWSELTGLLTEGQRRQLAYDIADGLPSPTEDNGYVFAPSPAALDPVTVERCAKVADSFTCGGCGMDGKAAAAIRALET